MLCLPSAAIAAQSDSGYVIFTDSGASPSVVAYPGGGSFDGSFSTAAAPEGTKVFKLVTNGSGFAGVAFDQGAGADLSLYSGGSVKFYVHAPGDVKIELEDGNGVTYSKQITQYGWSAGTDAGIWKEITVPVTDYVALGAPLNNIRYPAKITLISDGTFYFDNVRWVEGSGIKVYDFSSGKTVFSGEIAWQNVMGDGASFNPASLVQTGTETEFTSGQYQNVKWIESARSTTTSADPMLHRFRFQVRETRASLTYLKALWRGRHTSQNTQLYLWNNAASLWQRIAQTTVTASDVSLSSTIVTGFTNYVDSSGYLYLCAFSSEPVASSSLFSEYAVVYSTAPTGVEIVHSPITQALSGQVLGIGASFIAASAPTADLFYRIPGAGAYSSTPFSRFTVSGNAFNFAASAQIPKASITSSGIEYYVRATDGSNTYFSASASSPNVVAVTDQICSAQNLSGAPGILSVGGSAGRPAAALSGASSLVPTQICLKSPSNLGAPAPGSDLVSNPEPVVVAEVTPSGAPLVQPVTLSLAYPDINSDGVVDGTSIEAAALKLFWYDGIAWRRVGGAQNSVTQTVSAPLSHFSLYALFAAASTAGNSRAQEQIITPFRRDGVNDAANFDTIAGIPFSIQIYDLGGRLIKTEKTRPQWDGTNDFGQLVESGVYLYQVHQPEKTTSGIITVAK